MRHSTDYEGDVLVATLKGSWMNEPRSMDVHATIKAELERGARRVLIDLTRCRVSTSAGIGVCVAIHTSVEGVGGTLKLCAVSDNVRRALVVAGLWQFFEKKTYATKEDALEAFRQEAARELEETQAL